MFPRFCSTLLFLAGILSFFVYPDYFDMTTYMSENALSPNWSVFAYSSNREYTNLASRFTADYHAFQLSLSPSLSNSEWSKYVGVPDTLCRSIEGRKPRNYV